MELREDPGHTVLGAFVSRQLRHLTRYILQELSKLGLGVDTDIELRTLQLPVDYREVKRRLTTIWEDFQPQVSDTWRGCGSGNLMMGPGPRNFLDLDLDLKAGVHLN